MADARAVGRWHAAPGLIWTQFDDSDDWVVYHPASGNVHHLTATAKLLWTLVAAAGVASLADVRDTFAAQAGVPAGADASTTIRDALAALDRIGLIGPVAS